MGAALLSGLVSGGWAEASELAVSDPDPSRRELLTRTLPGLTIVDAPVAADDAVLAVKPEVAEAALRTLAGVGVTRVLSIVAGLSTGRLEAALGSGRVVVRAMPNAPARIGAGVAAISGGSAAKVADLDWAEGVLGAVGSVVRVAERHLDAVTALSGSGPAYVFLVAEAMIEAGVSAGLSREMSRSLVTGTVLGAARHDGRDRRRAGRAPRRGDLAGGYHRSRGADPRVQGGALGIHRGGGGGHRTVEAAWSVTALLGGERVPRRRRRSRRAAAVSASLVALGAVLAACSSSSSPSTTTALQRL